MPAFLSPAPSTEDVFGMTPGRQTPESPSLLRHERVDVGLAVFPLEQQGSTGSV